jgi:hypothetical protein
MIYKNELIGLSKKKKKRQEKIISILDKAMNIKDINEMNLKYNDLFEELYSDMEVYNIFYESAINKIVDMFNNYCYGCNISNIKFNHILYFRIPLTIFHNIRGGREYDKYNFLYLKWIEEKLLKVI